MAESIVVPSIFGLITIVGLFGNFTIIFVTFRSRTMRGVTNFFIMNNAISDILFLLLCVPITASQFVFADWIYGTVVCKFFAYIQHVSTF
ncbi:KiSS-1 receptor [Holothuria leucospilota]|uniref:KiSS-1 receptor n=1 Tax=Holothuria leucospilota TaxID=206669 RepID=A0A9Q1BLR1_HOLLE|nr:KiSS-1 receptor [Holothuria leucospilota]